MIGWDELLESTKSCVGAKRKGQLMKVKEPPSMGLVRRFPFVGFMFPMGSPIVPRVGRPHDLDGCDSCDVMFCRRCELGPTALSAMVLAATERSHRVVERDGSYSRLSTAVADTARR